MLPRSILRFALFGVVVWSAAGADWPHFLGPAGDVSSPETGLVETLSSAGLPVLWSRPVGSGYSAPSVSGDVLVVHHRVEGDEVVEACNAATGGTLWKTPYRSDFIDPFGYNNGPRCTPLLADGRCYTLGAEGALLCLDLKTGKQIWRRDTGREFRVPEAFFGVGSSPILIGDRLIVQVGGQPNSGVVALDAKTGATLWENVGEKTWNGVPMTGWPGERTVRWSPADPTYEKQASYCTPVSAKFHGRSHVLCVTRQGLVSLDPATGEHQFSFWFRARQNESVNAMTPVVQGDLIFLSSAYYRTGAVLLRVQPDGRGVQEIWRSTVLEMHWPRPVLHEGHLYGFSGRNEPDGSFRCVEWGTGKLKWERDEGFQRGGRGGDAAVNTFGRGSTIFADGRIIALGEAGLLGLFKPDAERIVEVGRWQVPGLRYPCWAGPVLAGGRLYLRSEDRLMCLDMKQP